MKCPHCLENFHDAPAYIYLGEDQQGHWHVKRSNCPSCGQNTYILETDSQAPNKPSLGSVAKGGFLLGGKRKVFQVWPKGSSRPPCPNEVRDENPAIAEDYVEACLVLPDSPKASAALSRRCLQSILREKGLVSNGRLVQEIEEVISRGTLPTHISDALHTVREIGNFSAHPNKSINTGEILPVEAGEAEWNLDVIEMLFDFYYIQPAKTKERKTELNRKLKEAGRSPINGDRDNSNDEH